MCIYLPPNDSVDEIHSTPPCVPNLEHLWYGTEAGFESSVALVVIQAYVSEGTDWGPSSRKP